MAEDARQHKDTAGWQDDSERSFYQRADPDDPDRCQAIGANGDQCRFLRTEHSDKCRMHGGMQDEARAEKQSLHAYRLAKYQARVGELATDPRVLSLRGEIGIARMTLERVVSRCRDDSDLLLRANQITTMVAQLERLIGTAAKLESKLGQLLDRATLSRLCDDLVAVISDHVQSEQLAVVADAVTAAVARAVQRGLEE